MKSNIATGVLALAIMTAAAKAEDMKAPSPVVLACVDKDGALISTEIVESSNIPDIDAAALKVAQAAKFAPGPRPFGKKKDKSCIKFKVKFVIRDGEVVPAES